MLVGDLTETETEIESGTENVALKFTHEMNQAPGTAAKPFFPQQQQVLTIIVKV